MKTLTLTDEQAEALERFLARRSSMLDDLALLRRTYGEAQNTAAERAEVAREGFLLADVLDALRRPARKVG